jgi:hypothetical protein
MSSSRARRRGNSLLLALLTAALLPALGLAQADAPVVVLAGAQLARVVPPGFYFEGQSAPTQTRNAAAARFGPRHHVVAGMVDTSGYSVEVRAKYEGFLITDASVMLEGQELQTGAYGFGFTDDQKFNVFDVGGRQVLSVNTTSDRTLRRPRPLLMQKRGNDVRLYSGRQFVTLSVR